ncbi:MAG: prolyl oligopeptidase family serine peptidase, partial [Bacteroidota bacterium]
VVFPQCPTNSNWNSASYDRTKTPLELKFDYSKQPTVALEMVFQLLEKLRNEEAVDEKRTYVTGLSMGGMGTFEAVWRHPEMFAAAAPICGGGDWKSYFKAAASVPFWIFHGDADAVVEVRFSREMYKRLKDLEGDVKYSEYSGVNHNSWDSAFAEKEFLGWMFSRSKK